MVTTHKKLLPINKDIMYGHSSIEPLSTGKIHKINVNIIKNKDYCNLPIKFDYRLNYSFLFHWLIDLENFQLCIP